MRKNCNNCNESKDGKQCSDWDSKKHLPFKKCWKPKPKLSLREQWLAEFGHYPSESKYIKWLEEKICQ